MLLGDSGASVVPESEVGVEGIEVTLVLGVKKDMLTVVYQREILPIAFLGRIDETEVKWIPSLKETELSKTVGFGDWISALQNGLPFEPLS